MLPALLAVCPLPGYAVVFESVNLPLVIPNNRVRRVRFAVCGPALLTRRRNNQDDISLFCS